MLLNVVSTFVLILCVLIASEASFRYCHPKLMRYRIRFYMVPYADVSNITTVGTAHAQSKSHLQAP